MNASLTEARRALVGATISAALFATLQLAAPFGVFGVVLSPLPVAYLAWAHGLRTALGAALLATTAIALGIEPFFGAEYLVQFGLGGMVLGHGTRQDRSPQWIVGIFGALTLGLFMVFLQASAMSAGTDPFGAAALMSGEWIAPLREALTAEGQDPKTLLAVQEYLQSLEWSLKNIPFGIVAGFGLLAGWFDAVLFRKYLTGKGVALTPWTAWTAPHWWIWIPIATGFITFFAEGRIKLVALNVLIPVGVLYFLQGMAVIESLMGKWATPGLIRAFVIALVFMQLQIFGALLALVGAFDQWIDLRNRLAPRKAED